MSNPLSLFRKYQKSLLIIFGVALMIVFTVGPLVQRFLGDSSGRSRDQAVVVYKGGEIGENEMSALRYRRTVLANFMQGITRMTIERQGQLRMFYTSFVPPTNDETSLLQTRLLSDQARNMGMTIEKDHVLSFLKTYTDNQIKADEFSQFVKNLTDGRMSMYQFLESLGDHLLAHRFTILMAQGLSPVSPVSQWDFYQRLNRRVEIEAVKYPVSDLLSKVDEPTEAEIAAAYEKGKNRYPSKSDPGFGFQERKLVAIGFIRADMEPMLEMAKANITDDQVKKFYEENKEQFRKVSLPSLDDIEASGATTGETEIDATSDQSTTNESTNEGDPIDRQPSEVESDGSGASSNPDDASSVENEAVEQEAVEPTEEDDNSGCGPQEDVEDPFDAEAEESTGDDLVNQNEIAGDVATGTSESDDDPAETAADDSNDAESDDTNPDPLEDASEQSEDKTVDDAAADTSDAGQTSTPANDSDLDDVPDKPKEPEFTPVEDVADEIRQRLARQMVTPEFEVRVNQAWQQMNDYFGTYVGWTATPEADRDAQPTPPNLEKIAAQFGFTAGNIPLIDVVELTEEDSTGNRIYPISSSFQKLANDQNASLVQTVFNDDYRPYDVRRMESGMIDSKYLVWKTDEKEKRVPTLEECRDIVIRAIKLNKAAEIARQELQDKAKQISQSGKSLTAYFGADKEVLEPAKFSWMTVGFLAQGIPQLTELPGINVGNNFMQDVYAIDPGDVGVAMDANEMNAYLIHVKSDEIIPGKEAFVRTGITDDVRRVRDTEFQIRISKWYEQFVEGQQIDWKRDPRTSSL